MATEILERFLNEEDGIEAVIAKIPAGFSVALRDTDANEYVGIVLIYPTLEQATAKAKEITK